VKWARRWPYVTVGWLWFLGTAVPVIGIVQVGIQAMADRYTYVPMIGLYLAVVWVVCELLFPKMKSALPILAVVALAGCFVLTRAGGSLTQ